jgi:hypothetical protein
MVVRTGQESERSLMTLAWLRARNVVVDRLASLLVAVGLAVLAWLYVRSRDQEILDNPIRARRALYELADVPVRFLCPPNFELRPQFVEPEGEKVSVRVWAPTAAELPAVVAYVDLTSREFGPGVYGSEPLRLQLPGQCHLAEPAPSAAAFRLVPGPESALEMQKDSVQNSRRP